MDPVIDERAVVRACLREHVGIRYANGMFRQEISDGKQVELPETWLDHGNPWEFERRERSFEIGFGGTVEGTDDADGAESARWIPDEHVLAVAYDTPIVGWRGQHVNALRLWSARAPDPLRLDVFNTGDYLGAVAADVVARAVMRGVYEARTLGDIQAYRTA